MLHIGTPAGLYLKLLFNLLAIVERNPPRTALEPSPACDRAIAGLDFHDGVHTDRDILRPCVVRPRSFADVKVGNADLHEKRHSGSCFRCVDVYTIYIYQALIFDTMPNMCFLPGNHAVSGIFCVSGHRAGNASVALYVYVTVAAVVKSGTPNLQSLKCMATVEGFSRPGIQPMRQCQ